MTAIYRRELHSYFTSPVGYVYLAVFYFFMGFYFFASNLLRNTADMSYLFSAMFNICLFVIPVLTMRLISEDRRNKTDQLLLTAPITLTELVLGKYLAAFTIFIAGMSASIVFALVLNYFTVPDWAAVFGHFLGLVLLGAALIAIGIFISALTESQVIAAVGSFTAGLMLMLLDGAATAVQEQSLQNILNALSFGRHYRSFTQGLLVVEDATFFVSVCIVFVFLTIRVLQRRRWN